MFSRWQKAPNNPPYESPQAFSQLYDRVHLLVFRYIYGLHNGPRQEAEDLTAETFTRAWNARKKFQGDESAAIGWLLKIARNLVIDTHRRAKVRPKVSDIPVDLDEALLADPDASPESQTLQREQTRILWQLLHTLSDTHREMLVLRYMLGWKVQDIGEHLSIPENTVSQTIRRQVQKLRRDWPESDE
ncbi:MAG: sigma-70 family RNA polymerase sigma factor [Anaerolineae bacterium]|nr:sigma-70 family RNA polymerase sigma factor [Anaerolineae bacterium]